MGSQTYRNFIKVIEKWPLDKSKEGKDIGEGLRLLLSSNFPSGPNSVLSDERHMKRQIEAAKFLAEDRLLKKYPRIYDSTFTGLPIEDLTQITSVEVLGQMTENADNKKTLVQRIKSAFGRPSNKDQS
eukprot:TRINITY_DN27950_c0_g2_i1.p1 TRINITY_DN27950_c0_g2~~TRINITY_DN27950_c0_g2_i1.p1  ORF type:complete len:147 (+),score=11.82 TRINITY_DN27950_c0_g2_i1:58-441(+)